LLLPCCHAFADAGIEMTAGECAVSYSVDLPDHDFLLLSFTAPNETGKKVIYAPDGLFEGEIALRYSQAGGKVKLTINTLDGKRQLASGTAALPAASDYQEAKGKASGKVTDLRLEETLGGVRYAFSCAGSDYLLLKVRSKQETALFPVYPREDGQYAGEIEMPLTYARTMITVQVLSGKQTVLTEAQARKGYEAPPAAERQEGRLSGVTVCIDPGHSENGRMVNEPLGPGLQGSTSGTAGMAQGVETLRKESIVVLEIGMLLRDELLRQGANVVMTRERQDIFHTNQERCQIAADAGADIMLRLHADLRENKSKLGFSVYAPLHSTYARAVADPPTYRAMGELMINAMKTRVGLPLEDRYGLVILSDQFVGNNWAKMTCVLIEMGMMSTPREDYLLSYPVYQQWLAEGMAQGVYEIAVYRGWLKD
jgi:N-acetylmuramoyl-L-alanine amidase